MSTVQYSTCTDRSSKIDTIKWSLHNFKNLKQRVSITAPVEKSQDNLSPRFGLKMYFPRHKNDIFELYIISPNPVCLECDLSIAASYQNYHNTTQDEIYNIKQEYHTTQANNWQYLGTVNKVFTYNSITINCKFKYHIIKKDIIDNSNLIKLQLSEDFENLLINELFSDVIMKSAEGSEYKVHKAVLASRSAVLKAHFEHNTTECHTNIIESPFDADVLQEVLTFIYSDKAPRVAEIPEKLLAAADYYQLNTLKSLCDEPLKKKCNIKNAMEMLQLADLYSANTLKQFTLQFIKNSSLGMITKTKGWAEVKSLELIKSVCEYIGADDKYINIDE